MAANASEAVVERMSESTYKLLNYRRLRIFAAILCLGSMDELSPLDAQEAPAATPKRLAP